MIKFFCDRCGIQIKEHNGEKYIRYDEEHGNDKCDKLLCPICYNKFIKFMNNENYLGEKPI